MERTAIDGKSQVCNLKALLLEKVHANAVEVFKNKGIEVDCYDKLEPEELMEKIGDYHIVGVRSKSKLTKEVLQKAKNLLCIGCFCIGTDQTDLTYAEERGIPVFNSPFCNTRSVAELVLAESIMLARQTFARSQECHQGVWNKVSKSCYEVRGKTMGIIGYGHVGSQVSVLAESLGMRVIFYDIESKLPLGNARACKSMHEVVREADFLTLHVPFTPETENMIGEPELKMMKPGSYFLNLARGKVAVLEAVAEALKSGHLRGAAVDVYPLEPAGKGEALVTPLQGIPNVILTPHIGGSTEEAQESIGEDVSHKILKYLFEACTVGSVNFPELALAVPKNKHHRLVNIHRNVPGVLNAINQLLADVNITGQVLGTTELTGYIIVEFDEYNVSQKEKLYEGLQALPETIYSRVVY
eukprot:CAMPEP_0114982840 /NCGR_PEP_ID=MMETSP0216-20121206/6358_1 /TAXON_ID=223996 /ORGANISM="Protocruzia adherens, Strain Boccale" /LENGTH=413 /DNA_ID=CAMNT_0002344737 /DNA_START=104 /DNA_END=1345 /DNA_ORIENTATION=-